jgi:hypothetical protein
VRPGILLLIVALSAVVPARADDVQGRWTDAVSSFEASLAGSPKPATRFNLVISYRALRRPVDVVRHAWAFLEENPGLVPGSGMFAPMSEQMVRAIWSSTIRSWDSGT